MSLVSVIIADVQTPAQPTPALSTVVPPKPQPPGREEQIRTKAHREASHKPFTTSEYSNLVSIAHVDNLPAQTKGKPICHLIIVIGPIPIKPLKKAFFSASDTADNNCCVCVTAAYWCMLGRTAVCSDLHIQVSAVEKQHPEQPH